MTNSQLPSHARVVKAHGAGNSFVVATDRFDEDNPSEAQVAALCSPAFGIGADGFIRAVERDGVWFMDYRNADGSKAEMCGNGVRVFVDHLRREDGEHVGYIEMSADGRFIPYDRLWVRRGEAMELDEAEAVLDAIGLRLLAEDWLLEEEDPQTGEASWARVRIREIHRNRVIVARAMEDLSATNIAKSVDLIGAIELPLPTTRLRSAS